MAFLREAAIRAIRGVLVVGVVSFLVLCGLGCKKAATPGADTRETDADVLKRAAEANAKAGKSMGGPPPAKAGQ